MVFSMLFLFCISALVSEMHLRFTAHVYLPINKASGFSSGVLGSGSWARGVRSVETTTALGMYRRF